MAVTSDGRAFVQYLDGDDVDASETSLPGYLNALPSIVSPGDVFSIDADYLEEITAGDEPRFVEVDEPKASSGETSPNAGLTKTELGEKLGLDAATVKATSKDDLVELADEYDRTHPEPIGATGDNADPEGMTTNE